MNSDNSDCQDQTLPEGFAPHRDLTEAIIGVFYQVYNELGQGFLESVYELAMQAVLEDVGLAVERQKLIKVHFRGRTVGVFRIDMLVEGCVALELKCCRVIDPVHEAQLLNYLRASDLEVGLILNFGSKPQVRRMQMSAERKRRLARP